MYPLMFALLLAPACWSSAAPLHIDLKEAVTLSQHEYRLGDIALLQGPAADALATTPLGRTPVPGTADAVSRGRVERLLRARGVSDTFAWSGAQVAHVRMATTAYSTAAVKDLARELLSKALAAPGRSVTLRPLDMPSALALPVGAVELQWRALDVRSAPRKQMTVQAEVSVDGVFFQTVSIPFAVEVNGPVLVARHALSKGQPLSCDDLISEQVELTAYADPVVACTPGMQLRREMQAREVLHSADVRAMPAVRQGGTVQLLQVRGEIRIEAAAIALRDGEVGQVVSVRIGNGTASVPALVTAPGQVILTGS
jgi:flagella basal body P-ring formation protein FlgA